MEDYVKAEWDEMVERAKGGLESSCPLLEDSVIVAVAEYIQYLEQITDMVKKFSYKYDSRLKQGG